MNQFIKLILIAAIASLSIGEVARPAHANGVGFTITSVSREVSVGGGPGDLVNSTLPGLFDETVDISGDPTATATQNTFVDADGFSGTLLAGGESSAGTAPYSYLAVEFALTTPHQVDLSVPLLTSEIDNASLGIIILNGANLYLYDPNIGDPFAGPVFLYDNGGRFGDVPAAFDSNDPISNFTDSFILPPGDYFFLVSAFASSNGGTGSSEVEFALTFTAIPEPATATLGLLGLGGLLMRRRREV